MTLQTWSDGTDGLGWGMGEILFLQAANKADIQA